MTRESGSETARQLVHMAMAGFALLLRYLSWWQAALLAAAALAFNRYILPGLGGVRLYRSPDVARGYAAGILFYPLSVLLLILIFPARLDIVAGAWGVLAFGDGMATFVGRRSRGPAIPWNREKTWTGTLAFVVFGGLAGSFLAWWCRPIVTPAPGLWFSLGAPWIAAVAAAAVETIPIRLDDNLSVPATAASVLWALSMMSPDTLQAAWGHAASAGPAALTVNVLAAAAGYRARTVSIAGAVSGAAIGSVIFISSGWRGWALLMATFVAASVTSRVGLRRKTLLGIAEERGGRRGAGNAIANTGVAAVAALLALTTPAAGPALLAFVAALTAAGSDTVASEIGKAFGRRTYRLPMLVSVPPGTSGAVSLEGTAAGLGAAGLLGILGVLVGLIPPHALLAVVLGATAGSLAESVMGATLEPAGIVNNDVLNFLNTAIAAGIAILIAGGTT